ncbi:hypothetical protein [Propionicimonas sp.]|uniref:hypothetical protein n=1 Tax=Propionicimonas sp. TaxID=1955623 RepID=UPI0039E6E8A2
MSTGSARLDYVVEQVWGRSVAEGVARATVNGPVPEGWEIREQYWAIPNAASAQLLVPVDRTAATRTLLDYARLRPLSTRLVRHALAGVGATGAPLSKDTLRIVAPAGAPPTTTAELGRLVGAGSTVLATLGVRTAANAKPTLELRDRDGDAIGFVKLAWNDLTRESIENEADALAGFGAQSRVEISAPGVVSRGTVAGGLPYVMTEPLPRGIRHVPASYASLSNAEALGPGKVVRRAPLESAGQVRLVLDRLAAATPVTPAPLARRATDLARSVTQLQVSMPIANFWHGDFTWWNTGRDRAARLWLFDWETAEADAPAGLDTLHWYAHTKDAENPASVVARTDRALDRCAGMLRTLGHSRAGVEALAAWYAATLVANEVRLAESLQSWKRVKHSPAILEDLLRWGAARIDRAALLPR